MVKPSVQTMTQTKKDIETIGIVVVLGLIAFGFIAMLVALARAPQLAKSDGAEAAVPVERSRESVRTYNKPLEVHAFSFGVDPDEAPAPEGKHDHLMPDAPDKSIENTMSTGPFNAAPNPPMRKTAKDDDLLADEDNKKGSGWGWLADDIMSPRALPGEKRRGDSMAAKDQQPPEKEEDADEDDPRRQAVRPAANDPFSRSSDQSPLLRPLRDLENERSDERERADRSVGVDRQNPRGENSDDLDAAGREQAENRAAGLVMRDPFARDTSEDRPAFGSRDWSTFGSGQESSFQRRDVEAYESRNVEAARGIGSLGGQFDDRSGRIVGDAVSDASRLSSAWSGYASDSVFSGGGGYTPRGVGSSGSDRLFSGAGVMGGGGGFIPMDTGASSAGGIAPIGGSSIGSLPTSGSSLNNSSLGSDRPNPSALPW
jgi:hypothetical protein